MTEAKTKVRKGTLFNRKMLAEDVWQDRCERVRQNSLKLVTDLDVLRIHLFLPIRKNQEIDTWPLLNALRTSGRQVVLSRTDFESRRMTHYWYSEKTKIQEDSFGIPTPMEGEVADFSNVELVFIPLLAADRSGNRVGYGKGFYDQLLSESMTKPVKAGLSISPPFDEFPFAEAHDVRLDYLVTHQEILKCHDRS